MDFEEFMKNMFDEGEEREHLERAKQNINSGLANEMVEQTMTYAMLFYDKAIENGLTKDQAFEILKMVLHSIIF
jgi:hypothetical protein